MTIRSVTTTALLGVAIVATMACYAGLALNPSDAVKAVLIRLGSCLRPGSVPVEFWLSIVVLATSRLSSAGWQVLRAVVVAGVGSGLAVGRPIAITSWLIAIGGLVLLVEATRVARSSWSETWQEMHLEARSAVRSRDGRYRLIIVCLVALTAAQLMRGGIVAAGNRDAAEQRLLDWYVAAQGDRIDEPLVVEIFTDYQCPSCRVLVPQYRAIAASRLGALTGSTVITRHYPLDASCNSDVPTAESPHPAACSAAVAVMVVREHRGDTAARALEDWFYEHQEDLSDHTIDTRLDFLGLADTFRDEREKHLERIRSDIAAAQKFGVFATPTLVVNGIRMPTLTPFGFDSLLRYETQRTAEDVVGKVGIR